MTIFNKKNHRHYADPISPTQMIVLSFALIIVVGAVLLMTPWAVTGSRLNVIDALFTAVSATCVTGLTVVNIGREFTLFGQLVVLLLIQMGGLGIMTFSTFFIYLLGRRVSLKEKEIIDSTLSYTPVRDIGRLLLKIMMIVFFVEGIGAVLLTLHWVKEVSLLRAVYYGIFHSVSSFCNAGFSLFATSFKAYRADPFLNSVVMMLIVLGGLGFVVLMDMERLLNRKKQIHRLSFHSKVVLLISGSLIVGGTLLIYWVEKDALLAGQSLGDGLLASLFQSVTSRTAGFNTLSMAELTNGACFITMFLMFIGASPGSCGGGVKVSTLGVLIAMVFSRMKGQDEPHLFKRTIPREATSKVLTIVLSATILIGAVFFGLLMTEKWAATPGESRGHFLELLFETISAFGTVGLSMGVTANLTPAGRVLILILMFVGRLGPLTLAVALTRSTKSGKFRYARGEIMVG